ncbi:Glycosyltransferase family 92 protein [Gracilariopsis chorda]|uniref:Glycosyltransferase family 92 protein n=1 Tax=Gracilariopsis chorda TaxID=448386 RepID=A0A2V3IJ59_9FLOR|nr:Glycosyltransferase family 92 protein [Gracilariopsis chorda]|eukprot:PXF42124.1 Glycosyltransferase family 92 protein [Gracilariopsis chorda]
MPSPRSCLSDRSSAKDPENGCAETPTNSKRAVPLFARLGISSTSVCFPRLVFLVLVVLLVTAVLAPPVVFRQEILSQQSWFHHYKDLATQAFTASNQTHSHATTPAPDQPLPDPVNAEEHATRPSSEQQQQRNAPDHIPPILEHDIYAEQAEKSTTDRDQQALYNETRHWPSPPHINATYRITRNTPGVDLLLQRDWTRPNILLHYARPHPKNRTQVELFVYATGINMGSFDRGFEVVGCLVGDDVYSAATLKGDVFTCRVHRAIEKGERISLVLPHNHSIDQQLKESVEIRSGLNVSLQEGDLIALSKQARFHIDGIEANAEDLHDFLFVNSTEKFEALGDDRDPNADDSEPRYEICLTTQIKPFTKYLDDWIAYYTRIGVDMVYIIDNDAEENLGETFKHRKEVQVLYWPWRRSQTQALSYMLVAARPRCEWLIQADVDEFAMLGIGKNHELAGKQVLRRYLRRRVDHKHKQFMFWFLVMGGSGHVETPDVPMPEAYVHRSASQPKNGKSAAFTDHWWRYSGVHSYGGVPAARAPVDHNSSNLFYPVEEEDQPIMIHYHSRAYEDMIIKENYGSGSTTDNKLNRKKTVEMPSAVPNWVTHVNDDLQYTHFRDIYKSIMKEPFALKQSLVKNVNGKRCVARQVDLDERLGSQVEDEQCDVS